MLPSCGNAYGSPHARVPLSRALRHSSWVVHGGALGAGPPKQCVTWPCAPLRRDPCSGDGPAVLPGATRMAGKTPREPPGTPCAPAPCPAEGDAPVLSTPAACIAPGDGGWVPGCPGVPAGDTLEAGGVRCLTAARPRSLPASHNEPWGEGEEDPAPPKLGRSHGPPGAQPQPGPLVQTCLLQDLEMGPLAQTQTLRDFEQVRLRGPGSPCQGPPSTSCRLRAGCLGWSGWAWRAGGGTRGRWRWDGEPRPPRPPRSPSPPSWLPRRGPPELGFHHPSRPRSSDSSNSSGRRKKQRTGGRVGAVSGCWRAGRDPGPCPRRHVRGARMPPSWSAGHG